jgi:hypothetical protein
MLSRTVCILSRWWWQQYSVAHADVNCRARDASYNLDLQGDHDSAVTHCGASGARVRPSAQTQCC